MKAKIGQWVSVKSPCVADCLDNVGRDIFGPGDAAVVTSDPMPSLCRERHTFQNAQYFNNDMRYQVGVSDDNMVKVEWSNGWQIVKGE